MCKIRNVCNCFPLPIVGLVLGWAGIIGNPLLIAYSIYYYQSEMQDIGKLVSTFLDEGIFYYFTIFLGFVIKVGILVYEFYQSVWLVRGVPKSNPKSIKIWLCLDVLDFIFIMDSVIVSLPTPTLNIYEFVLIWKIYWWIGMYSFYKNLKDSQKIIHPISSTLEKNNRQNQKEFHVSYINEKKSTANLGDIKSEFEDRDDSGSDKPLELLSKYMLTENGSNTNFNFDVESSIEDSDYTTSEKSLSYSTYARNKSNSKFDDSTTSEESFSHFFLTGNPKNKFIEKKLYKDSDFPASNESLSHSGTELNGVKWLRPHQICEKPLFIENGVSRFDVKQGNLGDCWFLAALAILAQDQDLFKNVVCEGNSFDKETYTGRFHFRFWQYGQWKRVVIDDRLPTRGGKLIFMRSSDPNEFWGALVEKAYAKLHGSYEALDGGHTAEAMEDFTGGISEVFQLNKAPDNLFQILKTAKKRKSLIGCGINEDRYEDSGLVPHHAYSVTAIMELEVGRKIVPLLRIRNPWGNETEWNGPWSDRSKEWSKISDAKKKRIDLAFKNDGEFWMAYDDFVKKFDDVEVCHLDPNLVSSHIDINKLEKASIRGEWSKNCPGSKFLLTIHGSKKERNVAIVSLMQQNDYRLRHSIWFDVYRYKTSDKNFLSSGKFKECREINKRCELRNGAYLIVPSIKNNNQAKFLLRVFCGREISIEEWN